MSAIDCTKHKLIGDLHFGYKRIPVYYVVDAQHMHKEFTTGNIYLGGGSGEHPALTVANFDYYAAIYMENHINSWLEDGDPEKYSEIETALDKILDVHEYRSGDDGNYYFNFNEWPISTWADMDRYIKNCKDEENNRYEANRALAYTIGYFLLTNCQNLLSEYTVEIYCKYVKEFISPYPLHISRATEVGNYSNKIQTIMIFRDLIPEEEFKIGDKVHVNYTNKAYKVSKNALRSHIYPFSVDYDNYTKHGVYVDLYDTAKHLFCKRIICNAYKRIYPLKYTNIKHR